MDTISKELNKMTLKLSGKSRITFNWARPGLLSIELWGPGEDRYGHGILLKETCLLGGEELASFLDGINGREKDQDEAA